MRGSLDSFLNKILQIDPTADSREVLLNLDENIGKDAIGRLIICDFIDSSTEEQVRSIYNEAGLNDWIKGGLGFFLFSRAADRFSKTNDSAQAKEATKYLREESTTSFLWSLYGIPPSYPKAMEKELYRVGTTSYIINLKSVWILKIIKPQFFNNLGIISATQDYINKYPVTSYAPKIHASDKRFIIMDFVEGVTLREHLQRYFHDVSGWGYSQAEKIAEVKSIISHLCHALKSYEEVGIQHFDLSPDNIILRDKDRNPVLIDFGVNYLLVERIGLSCDFASAQSYIAPELQKNLKGTARSDVYSLGIILLEMLSQKKMESQWISTHLDYAWSKFPDYARIIEEMIDGNQANRFFDVEEGNEKEIYDLITNRVASATQIYNEVYLRKRPSWQRIVESLPVFLFGNTRRVIELIRRFLKLRSDREAHPDVRRLTAWALLTEMMHIIIITLFTLFVIDDLGVAEFLTRLGLFTLVGGGYISAAIHRFNHGTWIQNLPGRLVGLSFSILAAQYYLNIFSTISARRLSKITEYCLRLNAFCFSLPILWAIIYNPQDWPLCSAIGLFFVGANNFFSYHTAKTAYNKIQKEFVIPPSASVEDFLNEYRTWWVGILWYVIVLLFAQIVIHRGLAKDIWIYAIVVSLVVNILMLYKNACTNKAPVIRGGLMRLFSGFERVKNKEEHKLKTVSLV